MLIRKQPLSVGQRAARAERKAGGASAPALHQPQTSSKLQIDRSRPESLRRLFGDGGSLHQSQDYPRPAAKTNFGQWPLKSSSSPAVASGRQCAATRGGSSRSSSS